MKNQDVHYQVQIDIFNILNSCLFLVKVNPKLITLFVIGKTDLNDGGKPRKLDKRMVVLQFVKQNHSINMGEDTIFGNM